jgi:hypothetical protein
MARNTEFDTVEQRGLRRLRKWFPRIAVVAAILGSLCAAFAFPALGVVITIVIAVVVWFICQPTGGGSGTGGMSGMADIIFAVAGVAVVCTVAAITILGFLGG